MSSAEKTHTVSEEEFMNKRPATPEPKKNSSEASDKESDMKNAHLKGDNVTISYGSEQAVKKRRYPFSDQQDHCGHRTLRLRKEHTAEGF